MGTVKLDAAQTRVAMKHLVAAHPGVPVPGPWIHPRWAAWWQEARLPGRLSADGHGWRIDGVDTLSEYQAIMRFVGAGELPA